MANADSQLQIPPARLMDSQTLVEQIRKLDLLPENDPAYIELAAMEQFFPEARELSRELVGREIITPYQANQLLTGKAEKLVVGPYRVLQRLGEGGTAIVFKARHYRMDRMVALKIIRQERIASQVAVGRFLREAEAAAKLSHSNIVRAYDADKTGDGYYFAMEFVDGVDLSRLVKSDGALPIDKACNYVMQAARGMQHIHENGMVHRDIKPSNLMVTNARESAAACVKILDLGLARLEEDPNAPNQREVLTKLGVVMGTPDYMSPEQAIHSRNADIRSDIYSLGCTFYYLLAGSPPFPGSNAVEKMLKHQLDEPEGIENRRAEAPMPLRVILRKMMAKKPNERYQTPREVEEALAILTDNRPAVAVPLHPQRAATPVEEPTEVPAPAQERAPVSSEDGYTEHFAFYDSEGNKILTKSAATDSSTADPTWNIWVVLTCVGIAAVLLLVLVGLALLRWR